MSLSQWRQDHPEEYRAQWEARNAALAQKKRDEGLACKKSEVKCPECGAVEDRLVARVAGWKFLPQKPFSAICVECL